MTFVATRARSTGAWAHARTVGGGRATLSTTALERIPVDGGADAFLPIVETELGVTRLDAGTHPLVIAHDGGGEVLVEGLRLVPTHPFVRRFTVRGSWPLGHDGAGFEGPLEREEPWRPAEAGEDGFLPLGAHVDPNQFVVADSRFLLDSPDDRAITLRLGSDDWLRVFVNGDELHRSRIHRAARPDQDFASTRTTDVGAVVRLSRWSPSGHPKASTPPPLPSRRTSIADRR